MTEEKIAAGLAALIQELAQLRGSLNGLRSDVQDQTKAIVESLDFVARSVARGEM